MHHILFIHGIGTHGEDWITEADNDTTVEEQFFASWDLYPFLAKHKGKIKLQSICYDKLFVSLYQSWAEEMGKVRTALKGLPGAEKKLDRHIKVVEQASQGQADNTWFYTHGLDLLLYWGSPLLQGAIVASVADQIDDYMLEDKRFQAGDSFSIIAHSMGTSVVHKALQSLYSLPKYKEVMSSVQKFQVLAQVSNTSYVLSADPHKHYDISLVKPSRNAAAGCCNFMLNISNRYDLVSEVIPFDPPLDEWLDKHTRNTIRYQNIRTKRITSTNVHSLAHYLENPTVHIPLFTSLLGKTIPKVERDIQYDDFDKRTPEGLFKATKNHFDKLKEGNFKSAMDLIGSLKEFRGLTDG